MSTATERLDAFNALVKRGAAANYPPLREQLREHYERLGLEPK